MVDLREMRALAEADDPLYTARQIARMSEILANFGLTTTAANGSVIVRGTTFPVKDVLKRFGFQFKKNPPEPYWERKGIDGLNYFLFYRSMLKKFQTKPAGVDQAQAEAKLEPEALRRFVNAPIAWTNYVTPTARLSSKKRGK